MRFSSKCPIIYRGNLPHHKFLHTVPEILERLLGCGCVLVRLKYDFWGVLCRWRTSPSNTLLVKWPQNTTIFSYNGMIFRTAHLAYKEYISTQIFRILHFGSGVWRPQCQRYIHIRFAISAGYPSEHQHTRPPDNNNAPPLFQAKPTAPNLSGDLFPQQHKIYHTVHRSARLRRNDTRRAPPVSPPRQCLSATSLRFVRHTGSN